MEGGREGERDRDMYIYIVREREREREMGTTCDTLSAPGTTEVTFCDTLDKPPFNYRGVQVCGVCNCRMQVYSWSACVEQVCASGWVIGRARAHTHTQTHVGRAQHTAATEWRRQSTASRRRARRICRRCASIREPQPQRVRRMYTNRRALKASGRSSEASRKRRGARHLFWLDEGLGKTRGCGNKGAGAF